MKILFLFFSLFLFGSSVSAQKLEDASKKTLGYISANGTVEDASRRTLGYFKSDGTVEKKEKKVTESPDGTIKKEEKKSTEKPEKP